MRKAPSERELAVAECCAADLSSFGCDDQNIADSMERAARCGAHLRDCHGVAPQSAIAEAFQEIAARRRAASQAATEAYRAGWDRMWAGRAARKALA